LSHKFNEVKREFASPKELADAFFKGEINYGDVVKCRAFISKYGQTYKPVSYLPKISGPAREMKAQMKIVGNRVHGEATLEMQMIPFQLPVEVLPSVELDGGEKARCSFLYDPGFFGFKFHGDINKDKLMGQNGTIADILMLPNEAKPIPIIMPGDKFQQYSEEEVMVKGVVQQMPVSLSGRLIGLYDASGKELFSLCMRPEVGERPFLCLSAIGDHGDVKKMDAAPRRVDANLFMEMHLSYKSLSTLSAGEIVSVLPNTFPLKGMGFQSYPGKTSYFTKGEVRAVGLDGKVFSVFSDVCLNDPADYKLKLEGLRNYYSVFCHNISKVAKKKGVQIDICPDFVFDYSKRQLFNTETILNSSEVNSIAVGPSVKQTIRWLNGS
jgi:hypothetical protein